MKSREKRPAFKEVAEYMIISENRIRLAFKQRIKIAVFRWKLLLAVNVSIQRECDGTPYRASSGRAIIATSMGGGGSVRTTSVHRLPPEYA